jgi:hypothetical protein
LIEDIALTTMTAATAASPEADVGAGTEVETIKHEVASGGSDAKGGDEEVRVAPQARPDDDDDVLLRSNTTDGEMNDVKLTPTDMQNQRQNMKDSLNGAIPLPPPLPEETGEVFEGQQQHHQHQDSSLHQNEFSLYDDPDSNYDPRYHESALGQDPASYRKNVRRIATSGGKEDRKPGMRHSHPRKSPYRSEVARLRHAQQQETAAMAAATSNGESITSSSKSKAFVSIRDTTAPPDTAFFAVQVAKTKHAILDSIGDFLTGAFADDEETSGSYYSEDLLEQLTASNPYLRGVWLQAKNLNDSHVQRLCDALIRNKVVTEVWLPSNHITDVGAGYIAHMLKFNRTIKELFLGENDIGPRGAAALASAVAKGNTTLVALGLGDNHIGVEGAGAFAAALRHNHSLHTLDIKNNGIPRRSSIRGLLNKMLEFNASDPGDESLVFGLQEELVKLVTNLPPDVAERVVVQAEEALKLAMLCRRRGDKVGAAEAEGLFIKICTTGVSPIDPPTKNGDGLSRGVKKQARSIKSKAGMDGLNSGMMSMKVIAEEDVDEDEKSKASEKTVAEVEDKTGLNETTVEKTSAD